MTVLLTVLTGLIYPGVVTGICQVLFRRQGEWKPDCTKWRGDRLVAASGRISQSLDISIRGLRLPATMAMIQRLRAARIWARPVRNCIDRMKASAEQFRKENPDLHGPIPADALTASGSGLDPHISVANADARRNESRKPAISVRREWLSAIAAATARRDSGFPGRAAGKRSGTEPAPGSQLPANR